MFHVKHLGEVERPHTPEDGMPDRKTPRAISLMFRLEINADTRRATVCAEIVYEDGVTRMKQIPSSLAVRLDLDAVYAEQDQTIPFRPDVTPKSSR
jgi:hypothetical protein